MNPEGWPPALDRRAGVPDQPGRGCEDATHVIRKSKKTPTRTTTARTAVTTGQTNAVIEMAPETPSSAKVATGLPPPLVVAVDIGRAAVRST